MIPGVVLAAIVELHCPQPAPVPSCALDTLVLAPEQVTVVEGDWGCDESVFHHVDAHVVGAPSGQYVEVRCTRTEFEDGDIGVYCQDRIAPVRWFDATPGTVVTMEWSACRSGGCSAPCSRNLLWPEVCSFSTRAELMECMGVVE